MTAYGVMEYGEGTYMNILTLRLTLLDILDPTF